MPNDTVTRFLNALSRESRERVAQLPADRQEQLAAAWEAEMSEDTDLDTLDELSPEAGAHEAAERVVQNF